MRRLAKAVHIVDGQERVLVNGVAVIAIANDERIDAVEFRDQHLQHAQRVHRAQRVCGVRSEQHFAQGIPQIRAFGDVDRQRGQARR